MTFKIKQNHENKDEMMDSKKDISKTGHKGYRRSKYFFEESFQGKYLFSYFILACLVMILFTLLFVYFSTDSLSITYENNQLKMGKTPEILFDSILSIHGILIIFSGFAILYYVTRFTHKTVGPLFKIGRTIELMAKGNLSTRIVLRKQDECKDLADRINHLNGVMNHKIHEIRMLSESLRQTTDSLVQDDHAVIRDDQRESLQDIHNRLVQWLDFFNLSRDLPEE